MTLDNALWYGGVLAEAAVLALLLYRRVWRTFPVFFVYVFWVLLIDAGNFEVLRLVGGPSTHGYLIAYVAERVGDSTLEICVLIELAWSVLLPIRPSLPKISLAVVALLVLATGAAIWPFSGIHGQAGLPPAWSVLVHVQQTSSILRILFFFVLTACSQFLSIGWRDRELQIASGLGFYSLVSVAVDILEQHQAMTPRFGVLSQVVAASYFCSWLYWVFSFAQKEAERREFTPQMQNLLLAVAGTARSSRIGLTDRTSRGDRDDRNRRE